MKLLLFPPFSQNGHFLKKATSTQHIFTQNFKPENRGAFFIIGSTILSRLFS